MKSKAFTALLAAALAVVAWATVETYRLWDATQQVAASQEKQIHMAAKLDAVRARQAHLATVDPSARGSSAPQK